MRTTTSPDGTEIAWDEAGDGDAVVLVHGITETSAAWAPVTDRLAETNRTVVLDLRGHGSSGSAAAYDLASMAADVAAVIDAAGVDHPHLVGHSLGGVVVSAVGASGVAASVTNVDQSLDLAAFQEQVVTFGPMLRDADSFPMVIGALFDQLVGDQLDPSERARIDGLRRPDQDVALGVWGLLLDEDQATVTATVDHVLCGYSSTETPTPYLSIFGIDLGDGYAGWLAERIPGVVVEYWDGAGHYPHLVDPDRFVGLLRSFWSGRLGGPSDSA